MLRVAILYVYAIFIEWEYLGHYIYVRLGDCDAIYFVFCPVFSTISHLCLTVIRRTHRVVECLHPTEFPFKSLRVFDRKRLYLVNRADGIMK
jgi:hypothetical protein